MIKKIKKFIAFWYETIMNYIMFYYMRAKANKLHKLTGKRYHVVPKGKTSLMVVDNSYINSYNKLVPKGQRITVIDLLKMSYYSTSVQGITRK